MKQHNLNGDFGLEEGEFFHMVLNPRYNLPDLKQASGVTQGAALELK